MASGNPLPEDRCEVCRVPLHHPHSGRPRRYCSKSCREKAYRSREPERAAQRLAQFGQMLERTLIGETTLSGTKAVPSDDAVRSTSDMTSATNSGDRDNEYP